MSKTKKKDVCLFNQNWLLDDRFSHWLKSSISSRFRAYCSFCNKEFDISNMDISAVTSHAAGKKHSDIVASRNSNSPSSAKTVSTISDLSFLLLLYELKCFGC